jgi:4-hydroxy-tetrahydrodipicolinate synthase
MQVEGIRGLVAPILTPFNDDRSVATDLYIAHAISLLDQGCAGIAPFGTTGEALSVGIDERITAIRDLIGGGVDPARMIPGTGLSNVADTARLSRACLDMGCAGVLTLPPFYFKSIDRSNRVGRTHLSLSHSTDRNCWYPTNTCRTATCRFPGSDRRH